ncbi:MAG: carbon storage regulator CsrA [Anaerovoracaceae bacterium]|jgi:carbon storage regulator
MLVMSRKSGESIVLSGNIKITVMSVSKDKVTIGIDAPEEVKIFREELLDTIEANKSSVVDQASLSSYTNLAEFIKQNNGK